MNLFKQDLTRCRDTALALIFAALLVWHFTGDGPFAYAALGISLLAMIVPAAFSPLAWAWFGLGHVMGAVMSRVILALVFFVLVVPVGFIRRAMGKDSMRLNLWKSSDESVFVVREHNFSAADMQKPF